MKLICTYFDNFVWGHCNRCCQTVSFSTWLCFSFHSETVWKQCTPCHAGYSSRQASFADDCINLLMQSLSSGTLLDPVYSTQKKCFKAVPVIFESFCYIKILWSASMFQMTLCNGSYFMPWILYNLSSMHHPHCTTTIKNMYIRD